MRLVLAGQPNSGKSTIFNAVAGYRSATANFPGSSVGYTRSRVMVLGREVEIVDLPGIYSLATTDEAERVSLEFLLSGDAEVIVNVVDATRLGRSLELTLQLMELGRPVVVALNMMDEARRKGIEVDLDRLREELGVPVVPTVARRGTGLRELFRTALRAGMSGAAPEPRPLDRETEEAVRRVAEALPEEPAVYPVPRRFLALRVLARDPGIVAAVERAVPGFADRVEPLVAELERRHGWRGDEVVMGHRHALAHAIEDRATTMHRRRLGWRERADRVLLHPVTGGPVMVAILAGFFYLIFGVGRMVEGPLVAAFDRLGAAIAAAFPAGGLVPALARGVILGVSGGVGIVLPYLVPFLLVLALLEDVGYLPRMAYILDGLMHRIGLHGKSVLPMVLGYGCTVPAIMATRVLESPRDRRLTAALTVFVPCSARSTVIYALVAAYLGPWWALGIYGLNLLVIAVLGHLLTARMKGRSPGLILEIPDLRAPSPGTLLAKTWLGLREFVTVAWPLLIASSVVLGLLEWARAEGAINTALSPLTVTLLGLPAAVGVTLVFGVLRKELSLVMLVQAMGTTQLATVMTPVQLVTFTLFVLFYVPCVATVAALARELGWRDTAWITGLTVLVATVVAFAARIALGLVL